MYLEDPNGGKIISIKGREAFLGEILPKNRSNVSQAVLHEFLRIRKNYQWS